MTHLQFSDTAKFIFTGFIINMQVLKANNINCYNSPVSFGINLHSKKLQFKEDDFYVNISGYGHHSGWAKKIRETADNAVKFIREKCDYEGTLQNVTQGVTEANQLVSDLDIEKRMYTGVLRTRRCGWEKCYDWRTVGNTPFTPYSSSAKNKYKIYADRLDYTAKHRLSNPYNDIKLTRPTYDKNLYGKILEHPSGKYIDNAFKHIDSIYDTLYTKYISNEAKTENLTDINSSIAEIRWILAHSTPWERGSDAISNTFIRSIYKAMGIKTYPLKRGVSLDLEAYCTNLNDYKNNFGNYFMKKPEIVD